MKILMLTQDEDCSLDDIVSTISIDPALTGRIIKLASSAQTAGTVQITTVKEAAVRLGLRSVCNVALGFSLVSGNRRGRCAGFDYDQFWSFSLASAVAAQTIAKEFEKGSPPEAFTLGLLVAVGRLALASVHPVEYSEVLRRIQKDSTLDLATLEQERFFIDHRQVAAALLEEWGLPPLFSEVALHFDGKADEGDYANRQTAELLRLLNAANMMAGVCVTDPERQPHLWPGLRRICEGLEARSSEVSRVFDLVVPQWEEWGGTLSVPTNAVLSSDELERLSIGQATTPGAAEGDAPKRRTGLRVLAVDDDPVSLRLLVSLLERDGHDVLTARDGKEALAVYLEKGAQMVVTDWMMPEMDGLMLCRQLRRTQEGQKLYILLLTGRTEEERIVEAFRVGADDYIVKPFKPELLRARIQPALRVIRLQEDYDRQVREKERLNRQLDIEKRKFKAAAMTDALTLLPNRRFAMRQMEKEWTNCKRNQSSFSVISMDIDHFKVVNDTWGHDVGDIVLQSTARAILKVLRRGDTCARMGGEEFLVICPSTEDAEGATKVAERIRLAVESNLIKAGEFDGRVTMSLGVATVTPEVASIDALLKIADQAVYAAKDAGRNVVVLGEPPQEGRRSA
jgi:diguanylate cyclase (GGDEF)-like protein